MSDDYKRAEEIIKKHRRGETTQESPMANSDDVVEKHIGKNFWARFASRGRITIPREVRESYDIERGQVAYFELKSILVEEE